MWERKRDLKSSAKVLILHTSVEICLGIINSMDLKKAASLCIFTIQGVPILILLCIQYRVGTSCSIRVSMHFKDIEFDFHYSRNGKRKILVDNEIQILWKKPFSTTYSFYWVTLAFMTKEPLVSRMNVRQVFPEFSGLGIVERGEHLSTLYCRTISKVLTKLQLAPAAYFFSPF